MQFRSIDPLHALWSALGRSDDASQAQAPERLVTIATDVRSFLKPQWKSMPRDDCWFWEPRSRNECGPSSEFLARALRDEGIDAAVRFGKGEDGQGYNNGKGWQNHAWAEAEGFVLCVTGDQFGGRPVIVTPIGDPRFLASNQTSNPYLPYIGETVDGWWLKWQTSRLSANLSVLSVGAAHRQLTHR